MQAGGMVVCDGCGESKSPQSFAARQLKRKRNGSGCCRCMACARDVEARATELAKAAKAADVIGRRRRLGPRRAKNAMH